MKPRLKIRGSMTTLGIIVLMAEGNPGALSVLCQMVKDDPVKGFMHILSLDDMNIRGHQIWLAFKDHANEDMKVFIEDIESRSMKMCAIVNQNMGPNDHVAVTSGASFMDREIGKWNKKL